MYLDFLVKIPDAPGKLVRVKKGKTTYIDYEYDRTYDKEKNTPDQDVRLLESYQKTTKQ